MFKLKNCVLYLSSLVFLTALLFALFFYFERLNSDCGYYFFKCYNKGFFQVEHNRFVLAISQILPVMASWLNLPVRVAAILYSLNHVLFFGAIWWLVFRKYKNVTAALMVLLVQFIGLRESVYTPQFELYYGIAFLILWFVMINDETPKNRHKFIPHFTSSIVLLLAFTSHPFAFILFFFLLVYLIMEYRKKMVYAGIFISFTILAYLLIKYFFTSEYESGKINQFFYALDHGMLRQFFRSDIYIKGFTLLFKYYLDVLVIFMAGIFWMVNKKEYWLTAHYFVSFFVMLSIIWIMFYPNPQGLDRYLEQVYFPLGFVVILPLIRIKIVDVIPWRICLGILIVFLFRISLISFKANDYKNRTASMEFLIQKARALNSGSKFYVTEKELGKDLYAAANWGFGFETLVLSCTDGGKPITITKDEDLNFNKNIEKLLPDEYLFSQWEIVKTRQLKKGKFPMQEGLYKLLNVKIPARK